MWDRSYGGGAFGPDLSRSALQLLFPKSWDWKHENMPVSLLCLSSIQYHSLSPTCRISPCFQDGIEASVSLFTDTLAPGAEQFPVASRSEELQQAEHRADAKAQLSSIKSDTMETFKKCKVSLCFLLIAFCFGKYRFFHNKVYVNI